MIEIVYFSGDFPEEWHGLVPLDQNNNLVMDFYDRDSGVFSPLSSFAAALANEEEQQSFSENESVAAILRDVTNYYPPEQNPPGRRYEQSGLWESSGNNHDSSIHAAIQPLIEDVVMDENIIKLVCFCFGLFVFPFWALCFSILGSFFCPPTIEIFESMAFFKRFSKLKKFFKLASLKVKSFPRQEVNVYSNSFSYEQIFFTHFDCGYVRTSLTSFRDSKQEAVDFPIKDE